MPNRDSDYASDREQSEMSNRNDGGENQRAEIQRGLGRIEGKLDSLTNTFDYHIKDDKANFIIIGTRLTELNKKVYGTAAVVTILLAGATAWANHLFK